MSWGIARKDSRIKSAYKRYLAFATLCYILASDDARSSYIKSAAEAYLLSLVMIAKGLENPAHVLMRQSLEMSLKHIYFSTHPVEYKWAQNKINYREVNFQFLLDYLRKSDELDIYKSKDLLITKIEEHFHLLSRYVHAHNIQFTSFSSEDYNLPSNAKSFERISKQAGELASLSIIILISFFRQKFFASQENEKSLIRSALLSNYKNEINEFAHHS